jgi:sialic acid synthase SpsE
MVDFIAEVSSNHNRDIGRMKEFISTANEIGCTGVKFQLFKIEELFAPEILEKDENVRKRKQWELDEGLIPELAAHAHELGLSFGCTPFYLDAVDVLQPSVDYYKIASYELLWLDLFKKCSDTGKPVVFSTGMATTDEVSDALNCLVENHCSEITILHCNSAYPTPIQDANLGAIRAIDEIINDINHPVKNNIKIGYSDHTVSPAVIYRAVHQYNASFVEFHLDLDGKGDEYAAGHCWLPHQIAEVISNVNSGLIADGGGIFAPTESELPDREWRADPSDGLRPIKDLRLKLSE